MLKSMADVKDIVTLEELACRLGLSKRWLYREAVELRIPSLKAGQRRLFNVDAVSETLAARAAEPEGGKP